MLRRDFINLSLGTVSMLMAPSLAFGKSLKKRHLILVELDGGNDGLNTVVPYSSRNYYNLREALGIEKKNLNIINKDFGINQNLENITALYKDKNCAIVNGLGYDNPKLSHFKSLELVETASQKNDVFHEGWFTKTLEKQNITSLKPAHAFIIGKRKKGHLFDDSLESVHFKSIQSFLNESKKFTASDSFSSNEMMDFLSQQNKMVFQARNALVKYANNIEIKEKFGESQIEQAFKQSAKIVKSDLEVPVIKLSHKGFDTHSNQIQRHEKMLQELDFAIGSFVKEVKTANKFDEVLILTYSEFGRRVKENGSLGTDHGTASIQFAIGGEIKGGMYGKHPSLDNLHKNNLIYTTHYRSLYNTVLNKWFNDPYNKFSKYEKLNFL